MVYPEIYLGIIILLIQCVTKSKLVSFNESA
jgi:hypothetical protein